MLHEAGQVFQVAPVLIEFVRLALNGDRLVHLHAVARRNDRRRPTMSRAQSQGSIQGTVTRKPTIDQAASRDGSGQASQRPTLETPEGERSTSHERKPALD